MTSGNIFPRRLTKIDDLTRPDHSYLDDDDTCYFLGEYTAKKGYTFSATNDLILNFKKSMDKKDKPEWHYKEAAIRKAALAFRSAIKDEWLQAATLVPIPPSKAKDEPLYDDRLIQMLNAMGSALDVRELIVQVQSMEPLHGSASRMRPEELARYYELDESFKEPAPTVIGLFDDVLVSGTHFKAAQLILKHEYPRSQIVGIFIARRVPETTDIEDLM